MPAKLRLCANNLLLVLLAILCVAKKSFAQETIHYLTETSPLVTPFPAMCGNGLMLEQLRKNPAFKVREEKINNDIRQEQDSLTNDSIITLPVVVHIVNTNPYLLTDQYVINGINLLNDAFSKSGVYSSAPGGADTKIRFCVSKKDPDGAITTGITRTTYILGSHLNMETEGDRLKELIEWDPSKYINIWLIEGIETEAFVSFSCGNWRRIRVGAFSTAPPASGPTDGIVIKAFDALFVHEVGHYLGLYDTYNGGCTNNNCNTDGDMVCDTPPENFSFNGCFPTNSCNTDSLSGFTRDVNDDVTNFMHVLNGACANKFTLGQANRMRSLIRVFRSGLLQDECTPPCSQNIIAAFTKNIPYPVTGDSVTFINTSSGAGRYQWLVNNIIIDTLQNFGYRFNTTGKFKVTLKVFDSPGCFAAYSDYVTVNCGVVARFYTLRQTLASKGGIHLDTLLFINNSYNVATNSSSGLTFKWHITDRLNFILDTVSNGDLQYAFQTPGDYYLNLIAFKGTCSDTTQSFTVHILDPTPDAAFYSVSATCYQQTKIKLDFCLLDRGIDSIPKNTPVNFYDADPRLATAHKLSPTYYLPTPSPGGDCGSCYSHIIDVGYPFLDKLYMVVADSGNSIPVVLPNTGWIEKDYSNNFSVATNIRFRATASPALATVLPCDTIRLTAGGSPVAGGPNTFLWFPTQGLNCPSCNSTILNTDSDRVKKVLVTSGYGCFDTAAVDIRVPPADDYTIHINSATCDSHDSINVNFSIFNGFNCRIIPKDIKVTFYYGNPATVNAMILSPVFTVPDPGFIGQNTFNTKIKRMNEGNLYAVVNDSLLLPPINLQNPRFAEINYTNNIHSVFYVPIKTTIDTSICEGQNYGGHTSSGDFIDTLGSYNGCDSIRTLHLIVRPVFHTNITTTICQGQNYDGYTATGDYTDVYPAINGCDSIRVLHLTVLPNSTITITISICAGQNYAGYTSSGNYLDIFTSANGCDSLRKLMLTVKPVFNTSIITSICEGQNYAGHTVSGTYIDVYTAMNGCDSTRTLNLTVKPTFNTTITTSICNGQNYAGHTSTGIYKDVYTASNGCDSTRMLFLTVKPTVQSTVSATICGGENYAGHTSSATYVDIYTAANGCDSTRTLYLTVNPAPVPDLGADRRICAGDILTLNPGNFSSYIWQDSSRNPSYSTGAPGKYYVLVTNTFGCKTSDTMKLLSLYPLPNNFLPPDSNVCRGNVVHLNAQGFINYLWNTGSNTSYIDVIQPGIYSVSVTDRHGCKGADTVSISYYKCSGIWIPNSFTPNGDHLNEFFKPMFPSPVTDYRMQIWSRWGVLVFETTNTVIGWDGTYQSQPQDIGAYVYIIKFKNFDGVGEEKKGVVVLVR